MKQILPTEFFRNAAEAHKLISNEGSIMYKRQFRFTSWLLAGVITICGIATLAPRVAWAHAVLVSAQPAENSTVAGPDVAVLLKYNSRVDIEHSTLTLLTPDGKLDKVAIGSEPDAGSAVCQADWAGQRSL